jgi:hypothetical protein
MVKTILASRKAPLNRIKKKINRRIAAWDISKAIKEF